MNGPIYRDLLWDFTYDGLDRKRGVKLRVFSSEEQILEARREWSPTFSVFLPLEHSTATDPRPDSTRAAPNYDRLMHLGRALWDAIPPEAKSPLLEATPEQPIRLKISGNTPAINDLPWEWLHDGAWEPFALRPSVRLVRSIPIPAPVPPTNTREELRVLLVLSNPNNERLMNPYAEIDAVSLRMWGPSYALRICEEATREALARDLQTWKPHIVHYVGHAGVNAGQGHLILHDPRGSTDWISGAELASLLPPSVGLLCLSTYRAAPNYQILGLPRLAHLSASYTLPTAIVNRYEVEEFSLRQFWFSFYYWLIAYEGNVNEAFDWAQRATVYSALQDWGSFSLVIRDQTGHALQLRPLASREPSQQEQDLQAVFASRWANELAGEVLQASSVLPKDVRAKLEDEAVAALARAKQLTRRDEP